MGGEDRVEYTVLTTKEIVDKLIDDLRQLFAENPTKYVLDPEAWTSDANSVINLSDGKHRWRRYTIEPATTGGIHPFFSPFHRVKFTNLIKQVINILEKEATEEKARHSMRRRLKQHP